MVVACRRRQVVGTLTLLPAPHFAEVVGLDADAEMLAEAAGEAALHRVTNAVWRHLWAEDLRRLALSRVIGGP
jgi:tRNA/tmRNA/rRNA uracil-C5-methylase (TrmA/RlmC/RlmD family)